MGQKAFDAAARAKSPLIARPAEVNERLTNSRLAWRAAAPRRSGELPDGHDLLGDEVAQDPSQPIGLVPHH